MRKDSPFFLPGSKIKVQKQTLISTLAWAARKNIPFDVALSSLARISFFKFSIRGIKPFFSTSIVEARKDLQNGYSLANVLETHFKWWIPKYYIKAIQLAEEEDCLTETLQFLADSSQTHDGRKREMMAALLYPFLIGCGLSFLIFRMSITILPKFNKIFADLTEGSLTSFYSELFFTGFISNYPLFSFILFLQLPPIFYLTFFTNYLNPVYAKIPLIRQVILKWNKLEAIQGMSVFLKMGKTLTDSLDLVIESQMNSRIKTKLLTIRNRISAGINFEKAWQEQFSKDSLELFYIENGVNSQSLDKNMSSLANYKAEVMSSKTRQFISLLEPVLFILLGFVVGSIIYVLHSNLSKIIAVQLENIS